MSVTERYTPEPLYSDMVAAEVRAMLARRGITNRQLADELGVPGAWVSRRISARGLRVAINVDELQAIARILDCSIGDLLPRQDSNLQPAGYRFSLATDGDRSSLVRVSTADDAACVSVA